nr:transposase [Acinetobacter sp.]
MQGIDQQIDDHIDQNPDLKNDKELLSSIPAIADRTSLLMLSFLRSHTFERASQAAAFVGLVPTQKQSGSSIHGRSHLSKAGSSKIRAGLYMAAIVATRHNPHIKGMNERLLANGKTKMMAIGAAMRKLVHLCYGVLKHQQPYQADY